MFNRLKLTFMLLSIALCVTCVSQCDASFVVDVEGSSIAAKQQQSSAPRGAQEDAVDPSEEDHWAAFEFQMNSAASLGGLDSGGGDGPTSGSSSAIVRGLLFPDFNGSFGLRLASSLRLPHSPVCELFRPPRGDHS